MKKTKASYFRFLNFFSNKGRKSNVQNFNLIFLKEFKFNFFFSFEKISTQQRSFATNKNELFRTN